MISCGFTPSSPATSTGPSSSPLAGWRPAEGWSVLPVGSGLDPGSVVGIKRHPLQPGYPFAQGGVHLLPQSGGEHSHVVGGRMGLHHHLIRGWPGDEEAVGPGASLHQPAHSGRQFKVVHGAMIAREMPSL